MRFKAWRNQGGMPTNARSCKHLRQLLGDAYENARLKFKNPDGDTLGKNSKKTATRSKGASKVADGDDACGDNDVKNKKAPSLLLANKWDLEEGADPTGWWMSEKLDGVRCAVG
jgi:DNA ligase-1